MTDKGTGMSDLWRRLRFVFVAILVYRIGTHIPIPGIDPDRLAALFDQNQGTIIEMFNLFSGGALERMSIFALNVVPYISSAIIMQLFSNSIPYLQELKKGWTSWKKYNYSVHKIWNCYSSLHSSISFGSYFICERSSIHTRPFILYFCCILCSCWNYVLNVVR